MCNMQKCKLLLHIVQHETCWHEVAGGVVLLPYWHHFLYENPDVAERVLAAKVAVENLAIFLYHTDTVPQCVSQEEIKEQREEVASFVEAAFQSIEDMEV